MDWGVVRPVVCRTRDPRGDEVWPVRVVVRCAGPGRGRPTEYPVPNVNVQGSPPGASPTTHSEETPLTL